MPDFLSGLSQALTQARTGYLQGNIAADDTNYQRALQQQLLDLQNQKAQQGAYHQNAGDALKLLGLRINAATGGVEIDPGALPNVGGGPTAPPSGPSAPQMPTPPLAQAPAPKPDTTFADIASGGAAPAPAPAPPPSLPQQGVPPAPPPPPANGVRFNPTAGKGAADRANKLQVAQTPNYKTMNVIDAGGKPQVFSYDSKTDLGLAPFDAPDGSFKKMQPIHPAQMQPFIKPTATGGAGSVPPEERLIWAEASKELKPLQDDAIKFVNAASALKSAENKNPVAYASALSKFVQATEQSTNLRQGLLFYFRDNLRPDVNGKLQLFIQRNVDGTYPPEVIAQLKAHVADMEKGIYDLYDGRWQHFAAQSPLVQRAFPSAETVFGKHGSAPASPSDNPTRASARAKIGLTP